MIEFPNTRCRSSCSDSMARKRHFLRRRRLGQRRRLQVAVLALMMGVQRCPRRSHIDVAARRRPGVGQIHRGQRCRQPLDLAGEARCMLVLMVKSGTSDAGILRSFSARRAGHGALGSAHVYTCRGRPILVAGSVIISRHCAIQPGSRPSANRTVNMRVGNHRLVDQAGGSPHSDTACARRKKSSARPLPSSRRAMSKEWVMDIRRSNTSCASL